MNKRVWDGSNPIPFLILFIYIMTELSKIAQKYLTDKGNTYYNSHGYTEIYDNYFQKLKEENRKIYILEIGIQCGYDLLMLNEYFEGNCEIYGIDINIAQCRIDDIPSNIHIIQMNGANKDELEKWYNDNALYSMIKLPMFDIIIDDGSHASLDIFNTLKFFYDKLSDNGLYIIEDLHHDDAKDALNYIAFCGINGVSIADDGLKIVQQHMTNCNLHYIYTNYNKQFISSVCSVIQFKK